MARPHKHRIRVRPGTAPGTLVAHEPDVDGRIRVIEYGPDGVEETDAVDPARAAGLRAADRVVWLDVHGSADVDLVRKIGDAFGFHRLALEDVVNVNQRPKVESYDDELFVVLRIAEPGVPDTEQISLFIGEGYVITFQEHEGDCFEPVRERIRHGRGRIRHHGPDYLAYALIDAVVDHFFPVLEAYGDQLEDLQELALDPSQRTLPSSILDIRKGLATVRRVIWPLRDALRALVGGEHPLITDGTRIYLRDCYDHVAQLHDLEQACRDLADNLMDLHLSSLSNRMNDVMRTLTIFAAVFIPLTFVAGIYGMNFDPAESRWNMPELGWGLGYPFALALMLVIGIAMLVYFWRKGWLR